MAVIGIIGTSIRMLAGGTGGAIHTDSTTDCIEHDSRGDCIDCVEWGGGRGCYPRREGGLILLGCTAPPALAILCPSVALHSGSRSCDASAGHSGSRGPNLQPASFHLQCEWPLTLPSGGSNRLNMPILVACRLQVGFLYFSG